MNKKRTKQDRDAKGYGDTINDEEGNNMMNNYTENFSKNYDELLKELSESLAHELYIEPDEIDMEASFMEMGLDSIIGVEWVRSINKKYGCTISTTKIYQYPNLVEFVKYMESELAGSSKDIKEEISYKHQDEKLISQNINESKLMEELMESLAEELYLDPEEIDMEASFTEMGLDSIIGVEWVRGINKKYGCTISTTKIYQYSNMTEFAKYLSRELGIDTPNTLDSLEAKPEYDTTQQDSQKQPEESENKIESEKLMEELIESLAEELYMEPDEINIDSSFTEMGLDSIIAVEWIRNINKRYHLSISTTKIYQYADLSSFSKFMSEMINGTGKEESNQEENAMNSNVEQASNGQLDDLLRKVYQGEVGVDDAKNFFR